MRRARSSRRLGESGDQACSERTGSSRQIPGTRLGETVQFPMRQTRQRVRTGLWDVASSRVYEYCRVGAEYNAQKRRCGTHFHISTPTCGQLGRWRACACMLGPKRGASVPRTVVRYVLTSPSAGRVRERAPSGREGGGGERAKWTISYTCSLICLRIPYLRCYYRYHSATPSPLYMKSFQGRHAFFDFRSQKTDPR